MQVTLPGEGKDRVFRVAIKWVAQVSLFALEEALEGRTRQIPFDAILVSKYVVISICLPKGAFSFLWSILEIRSKPYLLLYFNCQNK